MSEQLTVDVVIVGAGPAGLACAIKLKELAAERGESCEVILLEKGGSVGDHILSGAIIKPQILDNWFGQEWRSDLSSVVTNVVQDKMYFLTKERQFPLPVPALMKNSENVITSLSRVCRWLGEKAEQAGVMVLPGYAGRALLYQDGRVVGVKTGDMGLDKQGNKRSNFQEGTSIFAKTIVLAEGCRGSLSQEVIERYELATSAQNYGLGIKEVWRVPKTSHQKGLVVHAMGYPLDAKTYGGAFCYHWGEDMVTVGLVVGMDWQNPYLNPYQELQLMKHHSLFKEMLVGGEPIAYGARALNEGGYQGIPQLNFPGGVLIGCAAGFLNILQLKGTHYALASGVMAAEAIISERVASYDQIVRASWIGKELHKVRNIRPSFYRSQWSGMLYTGMFQYVFKGYEPWTFSLKPDHKALGTANRYSPKIYPKPDGKLSFDLTFLMRLTGTDHEENQPVHLQIKNSKTPIAINYQQYQSPETRYCPSGVYEVSKDQGEPKFIIHASNCIHCKTCDIKDPTQNIKWVPPQGGEGPRYQVT